MAEVAQLLGIAESCLYRWKKQDLVDRGLKPGTSQAESAELVAARQKIRDLEEENKILRKAATAVREVVPPKERYRLVAELRADWVRVRQACYVLDVSPSGYYDWKARAPSARSIRHAWLTDLICQVHAASYGTYGRPRVLAELQRTHSVIVGHNTVGLLMRRAGISGLPLRRRAKRVPAQQAVTDLVKRQFTADGPNRLWVTDITEHPAAASSSTSSAAAWTAGPSTPPSALTWPPTPWHGHRLPPAFARRDHSRRPRHAIHLLGFHHPGEECGPAALPRHGRRPV